MGDKQLAKYELVVVKEDNGELQEDVVHRDALSETRSEADMKDTHPASQPRLAGDAESQARPRLRDRVVERQPAPEVPERANPADPLPGTLPRPEPRPTAENA
jgi:hypothetical protein